MKIKTDFKSTLELKSLEITKSHFEKNSSDLSDIELNLAIEHQINKISNKTYEVALHISVSDKDNKLYVDVDSKAIFITEVSNKDIIEKNTIAIIFPFIRSYISNITMQPGMSPIVLPAINILAMIDGQNTKKHEH